MDKKIAGDEPHTGRTVLFISSEVLGRGEDAGLGTLLMQKFLHTLIGMNSRPETALFINSGVKLVAKDSPVLGELKELENKGMELLACGTCLDRFNLTKQMGAGQVTDMQTIARNLLGAQKVISL